MVNHNLTLDIMPYLEEDSEFMSEISPKNLEYWTTQNHHLYTVSDVLMLGGGYWYNADIFQQAGVGDLPQTWDEFETVCEKIQEWAENQNNNVEALHLTAESYLYYVDQIMAIHQTAILDNYLVINQTELYDVLDILENIYAYTSFAESEEYTYRDETDLFNDGKLAIYINGVWGASMIVDEINAKYALLPGEGTTISCESAGLGYVLGKTGSTGKEEASVRFLKYMLSEEVQSRILRETQQVPANQNVDIREYQEEMPRLCQAIETAKSAAIKIEVPNQLWSVQRREVFEEHIFDVLSQTLLRQTFYDLLK
jgi:ABC-type glycerol-3-phosphate transport system substrate-binding protein